jgi:outer membrane lipoprotein SlyB
MLRNITLAGPPPSSVRHLRRARFAAALSVLALLGACAAPVTRVTHVYEAPQASPARGVEYGTVQRIDVDETRQDVSGAGAVIGGVLGAVAGHGIGNGMGRAAATAIGAVGGAVLGNEVESNEAAARSGTHYRIFVRLDDGRERQFDRDELDGLRVGARVRVDGNMLEIS